MSDTVKNLHAQGSDLVEIVERGMKALGRDLKDIQVAISKTDPAIPLTDVFALSALNYINETTKITTVLKTELHTLSFLKEGSSLTTLLSKSDAQIRAALVGPASVCQWLGFAREKIGDLQSGVAAVAKKHPGNATGDLVKRTAKTVRAAEDLEKLVRARTKLMLQALESMQRTGR